MGKRVSFLGWLSLKGNPSKEKEEKKDATGQMGTGTDWGEKVKKYVPPQAHSDGPHVRGRVPIGCATSVNPSHCSTQLLESWHGQKA